MKRPGFRLLFQPTSRGASSTGLVRPKYNDALRFLDEGLAAAADIDLTCRLGLGYADGPIERVERGGLVHHYDVSQRLFETYRHAWALRRPDAPMWPNSVQMPMSE